MEWGVILTFSLCAVLYSGIMRLLVIGETPKWIILAQLIRNQQIRLGQRPFRLARMVAVLGFTQFCRKCCRILKQDMVSPGANFQTQSNRRMCLAPTGVSNHNDILPVPDKPAAGQFLQEQRRNRIIELAAVEFFHRFQVY